MHALVNALAAAPIPTMHCFTPVHLTVLLLPAFRTMDEYMFWLIYFTLCKRYLPQQQHTTEDAETAAVAAAGAAAAAAAGGESTARSSVGDASTTAEHASPSTANSSQGLAAQSEAGEGGAAPSCWYC
jgi:hypothetical protein